MFENLGHTQQDTRIDTNTTLQGMITGEVTVNNCSCFVVHGMVNGNITIENGSSFILYGTVIGDIINSGFCKILGVLKGKLLNEGGQSEVEVNAIIQENG